LKEHGLALCGTPRKIKLGFQNTAPFYNIWLIVDFHGNSASRLKYL